MTSQGERTDPMPRTHATTRHLARTATYATLALATLVVPALAQNDKPSQPGDKQLILEPRDVNGEALRFDIPDWSDADIAAFAQKLIGSWHSSSPMTQSDDGGAAEVWLHIAHTHIDGLDDVLYMELHRSDAADRPYRQSFAQLYRAGDTIHLRTLEPTRMASGLEPFAGFWAIPDQFPLFTSDHVVATMDVHAPQRRRLGGQGDAPLSHQPAGRNRDG